jgi:hypothetical protein
MNLGSSAFCFSAMELTELSLALQALGCPADRCPEMAAQLDRRARQVATEKGQPYEVAMAHLLQLMRQGWAAQERGF